MPCYHPVDAWRSKRVTSLKSGKPAIFFKKPHLWFIDDRSLKFYVPEELKLPCGKCIGCLETRSKAWAVRCLHESLMHDENCFITLTYNDEFCPKNNSLIKRDFQLFMKRLRKYLSEAVGQAKRVRFYMAGEYGEQFGRPHYHACLFGYNFPDRKLLMVRNDVRLDQSEILESLWSRNGKSLGFCSVGDVTFESAAYVARYILKKNFGDTADKHYGDREREYTSMSLKPGIGNTAFIKFKKSWYPDDFVVMPGGKKVKPPRYYDKLYELTEPEKFDMTRTLRKCKALEDPDSSPERLKVREVVKKAQMGLLKRSLK